MLGYLGNFFQQVLEPLLCSMGDVVHHLCTQVCHTVSPAWGKKIQQDVTCEA